MSSFSRILCSDLETYLYEIEANIFLIPEIDAFIFCSCFELFCFKWKITIPPLESFAWIVALCLDMTFLLNRRRHSTMFWWFSQLKVLHVFLLNQIHIEVQLSIFYNQLRKHYCYKCWCIIICHQHTGLLINEDPMDHPYQERCYHLLISISFGFSLKLTLSVTSYGHFKPAL